MTTIEATAILSNPTRTASYGYYERGKSLPEGEQENSPGPGSPVTGLCHWGGRTSEAQSWVKAQGKFKPRRGDAKGAQKLPFIGSEALFGVARCPAADLRL